MKNAYIFPGQGSQFPGMGLDLYQNIYEAKKLFNEADDFLGFKISNIMFRGSIEELKQTDIAQLAIFIHSVITAYVNKNFIPDMIAGHSVGEFSALAAIKAISFKDGLALVRTRSQAMHKTCKKYPGTMAAVLGAEDTVVEKVCKETECAYTANYNSPGQIVISGSVAGIKEASLKLNNLAKKIIQLNVAGAFHTPLMKEAENSLKKQIERTTINTLICPMYNNIDAQKTQNPEEVKEKLVRQLTAPVLWKQTIIKMLSDGATEFIEVGPGKVLTGLIKKII